MIITKTITLYGYKCEICGHETDLEKGGSDKPLSFCGNCGAKLLDDTQFHNTDNVNGK